MDFQASGVSLEFDPNGQLTQINNYQSEGHDRVVRLNGNSLSVDIHPHALQHRPTRRSYDPDSPDLQRWNQFTDAVAHSSQHPISRLVRRTAYEHLEQPRTVRQPNLTVMQPESCPVGNRYSRILQDIADAGIDTGNAVLCARYPDVKTKFVSFPSGKDRWERFFDKIVSSPRYGGSSDTSDVEDMSSAFSWLYRRYRRGTRPARRRFNHRTEAPSLLEAFPDLSRSDVQPCPLPVSVDASVEVDKHGHLVDVRLSGRSVRYATDNGYAINAVAALAQTPRQRRLERAFRSWFTKTREYQHQHMYLMDYVLTQLILESGMKRRTAKSPDELKFIAHRAYVSARARTK